MEKVVSLSMEVNLSALSFGLMQLQQEDIIELIKQLDLQIAEADFTETLILTLAKSFRNDLTGDEKERLIASIRSTMR